MTREEKLAAAVNLILNQAKIRGLRTEAGNLIRLTPETQKTLEESLEYPLQHGGPR